MTDYYPQEEGAVFDANSYIVPAYPGDVISEMSAVKFGTTVAGRISVLPAAAVGDGFAVALREATAAGAPTRIPILLHGIAKLTFAAASTQGGFVLNLAAPTTYQAGGTCLIAELVWGGGASYVLGLLLQTTVGVSGDALVLVGKTA